LDDLPPDLTLTLSAHNDINIDGSITYQGTGAPGINLTLVADSDSDGTGSFTLGATGDLLLTFSGTVGILDISAAGDIVLDGNIDTNGGSITLNSANGSISQAAATGSTNANDLVVTVAGDMDFLGANSFTNLNVLQTAPGNINIINNSNLSIDVISAVGSSVALTNTGTIDQAGAIGGIVAASLDITGDNNVTLQNAGNDVDSITTSNTSSVGPSHSFSYTDADDLVVLDMAINNTSGTGGSAFLDITSGGNMTLNGDIDATGDTTGTSGITLNAQNGSNIIYQGGTITTDTLNLQTDNDPTTVGAVGTAVNPIHIAAPNTSINIVHGSNGNGGAPNSGGDLFLLNTAGDLLVSSYMTASPSILQIENNAIAGNIDFGAVSLVDSIGLSTDTLTASDIRLVANGSLFLPAFLGTRPPAVAKPGFASRLSASGNIHLEGQSLSIDESIDAAGNIMLISDSLSIQNTAAVTSSAGNVELRSDFFNINGNVTAQNQVVIREFSAAGGLEINDATPTSGFATLTTADLGFLTGTNLGIVLGNDLAHSSAKIVQVMSAVISILPPTRLAEALSDEPPTTATDSAVSISTLPLKSISALSAIAVTVTSPCTVRLLPSKRTNSPT